MVAKTWQWAVVGGAALLVMGTGAAFTALQPSAGPVAPYEASGTPAQVAHGEYLFHHVMVCAGCHSERDLDVSGHPIRRLGAGSAPDAFDHAMGLPGVIYAPNITPTGSPQSRRRRPRTARIRWPAADTW